MELVIKILGFLAKILANRGTQWAVRGITIVAAAAGWEEAKTQPMLDATVTFIPAAVGLALDFLSHRLRDGYWFKAPTKKSRAWLLIPVLAVMLAGCGSMVDATAIKGSTDLICGRHDAYVTNDPTLSDLQRQTYLRSTELLRKVVDEAAAK